MAAKRMKHLTAHAATRHRNGEYTIAHLRVRHGCSRGQIVRRDGYAAVAHWIASNDEEGSGCRQRHDPQDEAKHAHPRPKIYAHGAPQNVGTNVSA